MANSVFDQARLMGFFYIDGEQGREISGVWCPRFLKSIKNQDTPALYLGWDEKAEQWVMEKENRDPHEVLADAAEHLFKNYYDENAEHYGESESETTWETATSEGQAAQMLQDIMNDECCVLCDKPPLLCACKED